MTLVLGKLVLDIHDTLVIDVHQTVFPFFLILNNRIRKLELLILFLGLLDGLLLPELLADGLVKLLVNLHKNVHFLCRNIAHEIIR